MSARNCARERSPTDHFTSTLDSDDSGWKGCSSDGEHPGVIFSQRRLLGQKGVSPSGASSPVDCLSRQKGLWIPTFSPQRSGKITGMQVRVHRRCVPNTSVPTTQIPILPLIPRRANTLKGETLGTTCLYCLHGYLGMWELGFREPSFSETSDLEVMLQCVYRF